jgi:hypothetical protein
MGPSVSSQHRTGETRAVVRLAYVGHHFYIYLRVSANRHLLLTYSVLYVVGIQQCHLPVHNHVFGVEGSDRRYMVVLNL